MRVVVRPLTDSTSGGNDHSTSHWQVRRQTSSTQGRWSNSAASPPCWSSSPWSSPLRDSCALPGTTADTLPVTSAAWGRPGTCDDRCSVGTGLDNLRQWIQTASCAHTFCPLHFILNRRIIVPNRDTEPEFSSTPFGEEKERSVYSALPTP